MVLSERRLLKIGLRAYKVPLSQVVSGPSWFQFTHHKPETHDRTLHYLVSYSVLSGCIVAYLLLSYMLLYHVHVHT